MKDVILLLLIALVALVGLAGRSEAVIYQYVDEKGDPSLVDDLGKVPEQYRTSARMVSGQVTTERTEEERVREVARVAVVLREEAELQARAEAWKKNRFILSGIVAAAVILVLVIMANLHALKFHDKITSWIRRTLISMLVVYLGIMHARDVLGLLGKASGTIQSVQDEQAKKGRKAAEFYKALDHIVEQKDASRQAGEDQDEQAKIGRQAEFYKAVDPLLDQKVQDAARKAEEGRAEEQH